MKWISIILLFTTVIADAQSNNRRATTRKRTAYSAATILKMVTAANGGDTWQQPQTLQLNGTAIWTPFGKTDSTNKIYFDDYAMYRVFPTDNDAARKANGKIRFDARYGDILYMQLIFDSAVSRNFLSERAKPYQKYFAWSNNFGFSIIRFALRDSFVIQKLTSDQVEGFDCYVVQVTDPKKMVTTFWIDQKTFYIRSVGFVTDLGWHQRIYSNFKKIQLPSNRFFVQPGRLRIYFEGIKWMDIDWQKAKVSEAIADKVFQ